MTKELFAELRAAAIDGRAHNVYYRQHQLEALHQGLIAHASELHEAIAADYGHTPAEIEIEIHMTLLALKSNYETLQPAKAHSEEYLIASGKNAPSNRVPAGIVYIKPCAHTLLYSVVAPLSAAIAGGNCAIVLLEKNLRSLTSVLRRILQQALHSDTFAIAESPIRDPAILGSALVIDQYYSADAFPSLDNLASPSHGVVFAVVDRTADVDLAAKELVAGRFSFRGKSPYAPDLVLVNDFVKETFLQAVVHEHRKLDVSSVGSGKRSSVKSGDEIEKFRKMDANMRVILEAKDAIVLDVLTRQSDMLDIKTAAPVLAVHAVTSLDDAIDFLGRAKAGPALAAYHFGNPQVGKYLAQFVDAQVSFVNHVPRDLLVGPARQLRPDLDLSIAYTVDMLSIHRPTFIRPSISSLKIAAAMSSANSSTAGTILKQTWSPLKAMKRKPGGGIGFFEQGLLINVGMILTIVISATATGIWILRNGRIPFMGLRV